MAVFMQPCPKTQLSNADGGTGRSTESGFGGKIFDTTSLDPLRSGSINFVPKYWSAGGDKVQRFVDYMRVPEQEAAFQVVSYSHITAPTTHRVSSWTPHGILPKTWIPNVSLPLDTPAWVEVGGYARMQYKGRIMSPERPTGSIVVRRNIFFIVVPVSRDGLQWTNDGQGRILTGFLWKESGPVPSNIITDY